MSNFIHETAVVDDGAKLGNFVKVWHWVHICAGAKIGSRSSLGQNVFIGDNVTIGENVRVQNNVSVYDGVIIEDDVFCGPSMVFTNVVNPRSHVNRKDEFKKTHVKKGATLGANCTVICGTIIGEYAFIAAGAVITEDVKPFSLMIGVPARHSGWMSKDGIKLDLPPVGEGSATCPKSGDSYHLSGGYLAKISP